MPILITSPHNPRVKNAVRLRQQRGRRQQGRILIDGLRETSRALHSKIQIDEAFFRDQSLENETLQQMVAELEQRNVFTARLSEAVFERLAYGNRHDGLVAVARPPHQTLDDLPVPTAALFVVLEHVEKPGNLGAVARTADAAGVDAVLLADPRCEPYNPNAIRASLGTVFLRPIVSDSTAHILQWLTDRRIQIVTTRVGGQQLYTDVDYRSATAIVLGSEAEGLSERWRVAESTEVALPMLGVGDSLNVSATAAIVCYEALRQRRTQRRYSGN